MQPYASGFAFGPAPESLRFRAARVRRRTQKRNHASEMSNGTPTIRIFAASGLMAFGALSRSSE